LKDDIRGELQVRKERDARREREEKSIDLLIERNPFDVPRSVLERFKGELYSEHEKRREMMGAPPEEDEQKKRQLDEFIERMALRNIKRYFLIGHISGLEKIKVTDEDIDAEVERIAGNSDKPVDEAKKVFAKGSENHRSLKNHLHEQKVFGVILGAADSDTADGS
jgi:trigger factor